MGRTDVVVTPLLLLHDRRLKALWRWILAICNPPFHLGATHMPQLTTKELDRAFSLSAQNKTPVQVLRWKPAIPHTHQKVLVVHV